MTQDLSWIVTGFMCVPFMKRSQSKINVCKRRERMSSILDTFHFEVPNNKCKFGAEVRDLS